MGLFTIAMLIIYTVACLFLIFVILIQAGDKGGGLSSLGASSQGLSDALGATGAEKTMNNVTSIAAITFIVLAIFLSVAVSSLKPENILPEASPVAPTVGETAPPASGLPGAPTQGGTLPEGAITVTPEASGTLPAGEIAPPEGAQPPVGNAPAPESAPAPPAAGQ